jgi:DNA repair protein RadC
MEKSTIKSWAEDDRPREKLALKGKNSLSDAELLAILLGSGTREKSALELAKDMLSKSAYNLNKFCKQSLKELTEFKGVGNAKAITILAAIELGNRRLDEGNEKRRKVNSSKDVFDFLYASFYGLNHEEFHVVFLNRKNEILSSALLSKGGLSQTIVDGKILFKMALEHKAASIILCHNHPSGNLTPSDQDLQITKSLNSFGKMIDLPILDHLIFADNNYFSFTDRNVSF